MWTGWHRNELAKMHQSISGTTKNSKNLSIELALSIFQMKLHTNLTYDHISVLMNYKSSIKDNRKWIAETCSFIPENPLTLFQIFVE